MGVRVGLGFDVHPFDAARPLVLGGVVLPDGPGLGGHSDADAVAHAVADALLAAAGLPDLGTRYPASDPAHAGAASMGFVAAIATELAAAGWTVANVSVVIAAEVPRLAPHVAAIASGVAAALDPLRDPADAEVAVSVTPKRGEGLGAVGRSEGIATWAVALLQR
ncbi:MAG: 2-C-methyl-D-erythritol 2,4-cyclodiphosphate synthase [Actinobacteria bacterium]|nr:2-C-methyl-D-erythritol 2,4-cyclodiphosphate synthase [Actinomycetota bacterium]